MLADTLAPPARSASENTDGIDVVPISPSIGAEIGGIDLSRELTDSEIARLRALLVRHKVLVFRDQDITPNQHVAFARRFGQLEVHPVFPRHPDFPELVLLGGDEKSPARENIYHSDVSWRAQPSMGSILRCVECPPCGGDTIWVNMALAYLNLPDHIKKAIEGLNAVHDMLPGFIDRIPEEDRPKVRDQFPPQSHPVVRTHPESGEKILYVSEGFTTHFANYIQSLQFTGMPGFAQEARVLLEYLCNQARRPEFQMRVRWQKNTIVFWDNRATQHYAIQDYFPVVRRMMRATVTGERPQ